MIDKHRAKRDAEEQAAEEAAARAADPADALEDTLIAPEIEVDPKPGKRDKRGKR